MFIALLCVTALVAVGCDSPKVSGSTAPLSDEERRQIAEQDKQTNDEESPGNKTLKGKKK